MKKSKENKMINKDAKLYRATTPTQALLKMIPQICAKKGFSK